jgi:hypothetical protein
LTHAHTHCYALNWQDRCAYATQEHAEGHERGADRDYRTCGRTAVDSAAAVALRTQKFPPFPALRAVTTAPASVPDPRNPAAIEGNTCFRVRGCSCSLCIDCSYVDDTRMQGSSAALMARCWPRLKNRVWKQRLSRTPALGPIEQRGYVCTRMRMRASGARRPYSSFFLFAPQRESSNFKGC